MSDLPVAEQTRPRRRRSRGRRRTSKGRHRRRVRLALFALGWVILPFACYPLIGAIATAGHDDDGNIDLGAATVPMAEFVVGLAASGGCMLAALRFRN